MFEIFAAGVLLNSALYLTAVLVAGIATNHGAAWRVAIAAMGVTFLSHLLGCATCRAPQSRALWGLQNVVTMVSIVLGLLAGLLLLA
jgi:hypothetical protein